MKNIALTFLLGLGVSLFGFAQDKNINFQELPVSGKYANTPSKFHRVDTVRYNDMPNAVKNLFTHSAGLFVAFKTSAPSIFAKWCVTDKKMSLNMTAIANKGLDVYIKNKDGKWQYASSKGTAKTCDEVKLVEELDNTEKEFLVYLPIWDEIKSIEIGVAEGFDVKPLDNPFKKNVIVYGSSIVHGASASRSGMTYPAILSRHTGINFINYGVSGNAKMEKEVVHMLGETDPDMFILDCVPNSSPDQVTERTSYLVNHLRQKHPKTPIVMIPSVVRELSFFNQVWNKRNKEQNANWKTEYNKLISAGIKDLYYIDSDNLLGDDHEGTTDGTHPNDLGFMRMVEVIEPFVVEVMKKYAILP